MIPSAGPVPATRRRRWLVAAASVWAVLVLLLAVYAQRRGPATVPEQQSLTAALPAVQRAAGAVLAVVGPDRAFVLRPLVVERGCHITPVRDGATASREVTVHVAPGSEAATMDAIAAALPARYGASVAHLRGGTVHELRADAGDFVAVHGSAATGAVTLRLQTGCRPVDAALPATTAADPEPTLAADVDRLRAALRLQGVGAPDTERVGCPGGGTATTVAIEGFPAPADLPAALRGVAAGGAAVVAEPQRYAFRAPAGWVVATVADGRVRLAVSRGC